MSSYRIQKMNAFLFVFCISILGLSFLVLPKKKISINEKRSLAQFPSLSMNSLLNGNYMDSIDLYFSDHFPWREQFITVANTIAENRGFADKNLKYYTRNAQPDSPSKTMDELENEDSLSLESIALDTNQTILTENNIDYHCIRHLINFVCHFIERN